MKKLLLGAISFLVLFSACKDDDNVNSNTTPPEETQLVTPEVRARIADPLNQNPFTGILEIYPCNAETSIYYGNFINGNKTVFNGYYTILDGHVYGEYNRRSIFLWEHTIWYIGELRNTMTPFIIHRPLTPPA